MVENPMEVLPECSAGFSDLRVKMSLVERDTQDQRKMIEKLTEGIEKIQEMNTNLVKMLAIHDQKHEMHEKIEDDIELDIKELHSRITTTSREIQDRIDQVKRDINARLDTMHHELVDHIVVKSKDTQNVMPNLETHHEVKHTLQELNRWKYVLITIVLFIVFVIEHVNWKFLFQLFGG